MAAGKSSILRIFVVSCILCLLSSVGEVDGKRPNIVFIVADDLGWNDVGFHNPDMITPNIDALAREGVILNQSYVQPVCSPSRHSFMTGIYPWKAGLQHLVIGDRQPVCSPLNMTFFPQQLRQAGYSTHVIGKWHLGFCKWECTPLYRGFESFYGYFNSREDYFTHHQGGFLDFHDGYKNVWTENGSYSAEIYASRAERIISQHDTSKPLFLYLPFQSVHEPLQVPPEYEALYPNIQTAGRKTFCGMVTALDAAIGRVVTALKKRGLYNDTLLFFTPDNGGWIPYHGNNWPLRGGKITVWEGGTRTAGFVSGAALQNKGSTFNGLMHAVDWHSTILEAAGLDTGEGLDSISQWKSISTGSPGKRTEFVYNFDNDTNPREGHAAIRVGDYKLISGYPGADSGWYPPDKEFEPGHVDNSSTLKKGLNKGDSVKCSTCRDADNSVYLFNLKVDPTERNNLAEKLPDVVEKLKTRMNQYREHMVPENFPAPDPKSDPKYFGEAWGPGWCN